MDSFSAAAKITENTLKEPNTDKALRYLLNYSEALQVLYGIDQADIITEALKLDTRLLNGSLKEIIILDKSKFNANGTLYVTRAKALECLKGNCKAVLYVYSEGL